MTGRPPPLAANGPKPGGRPSPGCLVRERDRQTLCRVRRVSHVVGNILRCFARGWPSFERSAAPATRRRSALARNRYYQTDTCGRVSLLEWLRLFDLSTIGLARR